MIPRHEAFSFWTHAVGALASVALLVLMAIFAEGPKAVTAFVIYGASLVLLFCSSSFHHVVGTMGDKWHAISKRLDHIAIYLLIAGTYTPVCLLALTPGWGWSIFGVIWGLAIIGSIAKGFWPHMPRWLTVSLYIGMGWVVVVAGVPLYNAVGLAGVLVLLLGGLIYSGGAVIYAKKKPDPFPEWMGFHGVWHVFVLGGAAAHVVFMWLWVL